LSYIAQSKINLIDIVQPAFYFHKLALRTPNPNLKALLTESTKMEQGIMSRITEAEVAEIVEAILQDLSSGRATIQELISEIPNRMNLSAEDLAPSQTRPNEALWEQQVRNITSHKASPGNAIYEGKLIAIPGGLALPGKEAAA
jgi:hypothetical protein